MGLSGYRAIARTIGERIAAGDYTPGEKIPSIRQFAKEFQCNKLTVHRAFEILRQQNVIENRVGSGSYVRFPENVAAPSAIFDFRTDYLDPGLFPYDQVQAIFNQLFHDQKAHALAPTPAEGDNGLIDVLSQHYRLPARRMVIISGAQQGLDLVAKVFSAKISEALLFEDPTYPGAISLFKARHFVPLCDDGPDLDGLHEKLKGPIRLFYTMPAVHNPTGLAYSLEKKEAVSRLASAHNFFIVEDDCLSEFRHPPMPRFVDLCPDRTIYVKSLSQVTVAGIRLGFMVLPEALFKKFLYAKFSSDIASFGMMQRCMREFISQGFFQGHLAGIERKAHFRRQQLLGVVETVDHLGVAPNQEGFSLWVKSSRPLPAGPLPWCRGEEFSFTAQARAHFRLSFMHMDDSRFRRGLDYLRKILSE